MSSRRTSEDTAGFQLSMLNYLPVEGWMNKRGWWQGEANVWEENVALLTFLKIHLNKNCLHGFNRSTKLSLYIKQEWKRLRVLGAGDMHSALRKVLRLPSCFSPLWFGLLHKTEKNACIPTPIHSTTPLMKYTWADIVVNLSTCPVIENHKLCPIQGGIAGGVQEV